MPLFEFLLGIHCDSLLMWRKSDTFSFEYIEHCTSIDKFASGRDLSKILRDRGERDRETENLIRTIDVQY